MTRGMLIGQTATTSGVTLLVGLGAVSMPPADRYEVHIEGRARPVPVTNWDSIGPPGTTLRRLIDRYNGKHVAPVRIAKLRLSDLEAGRSYTVELVDRSTRAVVACARVRTLDNGATGRFNLVFGSCHSLPHRPADQRRIAEFLVDAYTELERTEGPVAANLWLGDQVYVDDRITENIKGTDPFRVITNYYAGAWGLRPDEVPSGLATMMTRAANWYLPDDHEFWNDFPRASVTLPVHTAKRLLHHGYRYLRNKGEMPHPYDQGAWGRTAGAAYITFQSPFPGAHRSFGRDSTPSLVQEIDQHGVKVVLVDTRWRRTMSKSRSHSGFLPEDDFAQLEAALSVEAPVVMGLARPIIGHLSHRGWFTDGWEAGPEHYRRQYRRLWRALAARAAAGQPTMVIAGDVHRHSVKLTNDGTLAEFVCPPLSLLPSLRSLADESEQSILGRLMDLKETAYKKLWRVRHGDTAHVDPDRIDLPDWNSASVEGTRILGETGCSPWEGLSMLTIDHSADGMLEVTCHYRLRHVINGTDKPDSVTLRWNGQRWEERSDG